MKVKFQVVTPDAVRTTSDNGSLGLLVDMINEVAGMEEAMNVQGWSEICGVGEIYEGDNFRVTCLG